MVSSRGLHLSFHGPRGSLTSCRRTVVQFIAALGTHVRIFAENANNARYFVKGGRGNRLGRGYVRAWRVTSRYARADRLINSNLLPGVESTAGRRDVRSRSKVAPWYSKKSGPSQVEFLLAETGSEAEPDHYCHGEQLAREGESKTIRCLRMSASKSTSVQRSD